MAKKKKTSGKVDTTKNNTSFKDWISLQGVRTNNLKDFDVSIPKNKITTVTGVSGSGKSSLAFNTIYKEGQFRYIESLSSYLRQFFNLGTRPELDQSTGLSPAIAIEQNKRVGNTRSTVGTLTELDDYLRLLMAKVGSVYCYTCGKPLKPKTTEKIVGDVHARYDGKKVYLLQEVATFTEEKALLQWARKNRKKVDQGGGFTRFVVGDHWNFEEKTFEDIVEYFYLEDPEIPAHRMPAVVYGVFDRVTINDATVKRLKDDTIKMLTRADKFGVMVIDDASQAVPQATHTDEGTYEFLLLHGYKGAPDANWLPRLKKHLEAQGHKVTVPALPHSDDPNVEEQVDFVLKHGNFHENTILVGHSLGGVVAQKVAEKVQSKIAGIVLVASFGEPKLKTGYKNFYETTDRIFDVDKIRGNVEKIAILHDKKDKYIPKSQANLLKKRYGGLEVVTAEKPHFTNDEEPAIQELLDEVFLQGVDDTGSDSGEGEGANDLSKNGSETSSKVGSQAGSKGKGKEGAQGASKAGGKDGSQAGSNKPATQPIEKITWYTDKYYCAQDNISYPEFTTQHFSPNRQEGACENCQGTGEELLVDIDKILDPSATYLKAILPWRDSKYGQAILKKLAKIYQVDENAVWSDLPGWFREVVINGDDEVMKVSTGGGKYESMHYKGVQDVLVMQYRKGVLTVDFQAMLDMRACSVCEGAKLRQEVLHVFLSTDQLEDKQGELKHEHELEDKYNIFDLQSMEIQKLIAFLQQFQKTSQAPQQLIERILTPLLERASTITDLGLGYLNTARKIDSLSGGEIQRLRLAKQLGNKLTGILYVLDEPTIGLDTREIKKVIRAIEELRDMGNTIIVVEHNEEFIEASDRITEIGPGAGDFGGELLFNGPYKDFLKSGTLTAEYITGEKTVQATFGHTPSKQAVSIRKASKYNLQKVDVDINLGSFTIITGSSGAGKTTLMYHTLYKFFKDKEKFIQSYIRLKLLKDGMSWQEIIQAPIMKRDQYEQYEVQAVQEFYKEISVESILGYEEIDNVLYVTQKSIGKTPRSCPATFIKVFDDMRSIFAGVTEAKMLAFGKGHFSFNSSKGACPECKGYGYKKVELQFLPDTYVNCPLCDGRRFKPEILDIKWHDKNIAQVLDMYVEEGYEFFKDVPFIAEKLKLMIDIGLGYLKLGQPAPTLSGGESQRIKLVKHLLKSYTGHTVYFLDEPTVGLHPSDIEKLLKVLRKFLDNGDTILMIEHEKSLLKFADKVIRLTDGGVTK